MMILGHLMTSQDWDTPTLSGYNVTSACFERFYGNLNVRAPPDGVKNFTVSNFFD